MDMNIEKDEIFIKVKGIGFVFLLDKRMKHNLISPAFLAFFDFVVISMLAVVLLPAIFPLARIL